MRRKCINQLDIDARQTIPIHRWTTLERIHNQWGAEYANHRQSYHGQQVLKDTKPIHAHFTGSTRLSSRRTPPRPPCSLTSDIIAMCKAPVASFVGSALYVK